MKRPIEDYFSPRDFHWFCMGMGVAFAIVAAMIFLSGCGLPPQSKDDPCWRHMFDALPAAACDNRLAGDRQACDYGDTAACLDYVQAQNWEMRRAGVMLGAAEYLNYGR